HRRGGGRIRGDRARGGPAGRWSARAAPWARRPGAGPAIHPTSCGARCVPPGRTRRRRPARTEREGVEVGACVAGLCRKERMVARPLDARERARLTLKWVGGEVVIRLAPNARSPNGPACHSHTRAPTVE